MCVVQCIDKLYLNLTLLLLTFTITCTYACSYTYTHAGYIGELNDLNLRPDEDEVEQVFTIPLKDLLDDRKWTHKDFCTPAYHGGPFVIWGLTAYLLHRFINDVVQRMHFKVEC